MEEDDFLQLCSFRFDTPRLSFLQTNEASHDPKCIKYFRTVGSVAKQLTIDAALLLNSSSSSSISNRSSRSHSRSSSSRSGGENYMLYTNY